MSSADFGAFILGSRSLVSQEVDGDRDAARQRRVAGMRFGEEDSRADIVGAERVKL